MYEGWQQNKMTEGRDFRGAFTCTLGGAESKRGSRKDSSCPRE